MPVDGLTGVVFVGVVGWDAVAFDDVADVFGWDCAPITLDEDLRVVESFHTAFGAELSGAADAANVPCGESF